MQRINEESTNNNSKADNNNNNNNSNELLAVDNAMMNRNEVMVNGNSHLDGNDLMAPQPRVTGTFTDEAVSDSDLDVEEDVAKSKKNERNKRPNRKRQRNKDKDKSRTTRTHRNHYDSTDDEYDDDQSCDDDEMFLDKQEGDQVDDQAEDDPTEHTTAPNSEASDQNKSTEQAVNYDDIESNSNHNSKPDGSTDWNEDIQKPPSSLRVSSKSNSNSKRHINKSSSSETTNSDHEEDDDEEGEGKHHSGCVTWTKRLVLLVLVLVAAVVAYGIYTYSSQEELEGYHSRFDDSADQILEVLKINADDTLEFFQSWSLHITIGVVNTTAWPFVTLPHFEAEGQDAIAKSGARLVAISPIVTQDQRNDWEDYSVANQGWVQEELDYAYYAQQEQQEQEQQRPKINHTGITPYIFRPVFPQLRAPDDTPIVQDKYLPIWQASPIADNTVIINYDTFNFSFVPRVYNRMIQVNEPILSETINAYPNAYGPPESFLAVPIYNQVERRTVTNTTSGSSSSKQRKIVAVLIAMLKWEDYFDHLVPEGIPPMVIVVRNPCSLQNFSYQVDGPNVTFMGLGDQHDDQYADLEVSASFDALSIKHGEGCESTVHVYPTQVFYETYVTNLPLIYTLIAVALMFLTAMVFLLYDWAVKRKQQKIMTAAQISDSIINSLFPETIRARLVGDMRRKKTIPPKRSRSLGKANSKRSAGSNNNNSNKSSVSSSEVGKGGGRAGGSVNGGEDINETIKNIHRHNKQSVKAANRPISTMIHNSKPIADLFPNTTVLFADIAGFTAWASSREPSHVFILLETIYNAFDKLAAKSRVFKVETIGDCYVAAAGLPEAREDHAVVMARFACDCLSKMSEVVRDLEVALGPDTAELGMRAGLNSGPVTAGVLRGEKSRFQLFGDTVNTASRMESTGVINCIHLSQQTADLVLSACDDLMVRPRDETVDIKGKGKLQTYWLVHEDLSQSLSGSTSFSVDQSGNISCSGSGPAIRRDRSSFALASLDSEGFSQIFRSATVANLPASDKKIRLIDWNVDVLQGLLKKIIGMRKPELKKSTKKIAKMKIKQLEDSMIIDEVKEIVYIPTITSEYFKDPETVILGSVISAQLRDFVTVIAAKYNKNHFHSFEHASHVTQSVIKLMSRIVAPTAIDYEKLTYKKKASAALHEYTHGITSDPLTQFAAAFAALIHDLDHPGVPNAQLIKEQTRDAKKYKDKSVAEQNSVDIAWELLMKPEYVDLRACIYNSRRELYRFRQLVVNAVMATDIVDKDLKKLRNDRWDRAFMGSHLAPPDLKTAAEDMNRKATIVIEHLIQASDISHTMQHWSVYIKWNERFFHECYQAYLDGRAEKDPADGWFKGELGFFDFYIIPLAKKLKECGVFGVTSDEFLSYAESNRAEWERKGEELVEKYIASYKELVFGMFRGQSQRPIKFAPN